MQHVQHAALYSAMAKVRQTMPIANQDISKARGMLNSFGRICCHRLQALQSLDLGANRTLGAAMLGCAHTTQAHGGRFDDATSASRLGSQHKARLLNCLTKCDVFEAVRTR